MTCLHIQVGEVSERERDRSPSDAQSELSEGLTVERTIEVLVITVHVFIGSCNDCVSF